MPTVNNNNLAENGALTGITTRSPTTGGLISSGLVPLVDPSQVNLTGQERWTLDFFWKAASFNSANFIFEEFWHRLGLGLSPFLFADDI